jgi:hypothetical protein
VLGVPLCVMAIGLWLGREDAWIFVNIRLRGAVPPRYRFCRVTCGMFILLLVRFGNTAPAFPIVVLGPVW